MPNFLPSLKTGLVAGLGVWLTAAGLGVGAEKGEVEAFKLAPEVEAEWGRIVEAARPLRAVKDTQRMEKVVEGLRKEHELGEQAVAELSAAVPAVVAESARHWEQFLRRIHRPNLQGSAASGLAAIKRLGADPVVTMAGHEISFYLLPQELGPFVEAVGKALPAEAFAEWNGGRLKRAEQRRAQAREWVAKGMEMNDPEKIFERQFEPFMREASQVLDAAGTEYKSLEARVAEWGKAYAAACRELSLLRADSFLLAGPGWTNAEERGSYLSLAPRATLLPGQLNELRERMPAEARAALAQQTRQREQRAGEAVARARVMVIEMMTHLDEAQRAAVEKLAAGEPVEMSDPLLVMDSQPEPWRVWRDEAAKKLNGILDDRQERLVAQGLAALLAGNAGTRWQGGEESKLTRHPALGPVDKSEVESVISKFLAETSQNHAVRGLEKWMREVDSVARVAGLDDKARETLELAAKGTMQVAMEEYRTNQGRYVRSQTQGATPETIHQCLRTVGGYSFNTNRGEKTLVEEELQKLLNESQRTEVEACKQGVAQRREEATLLVALARLDKQMALTADQHKGLLEVMRGVMKKYGQDIETHFRGWGDGLPWYLQSYYLMVPCAGVEEKELKTLLNERQRTVWEEQVTGRGGNYWGQILEYHEQRLLEEKQAKAQ